MLRFKVIIILLGTLLSSWGYANQYSAFILGNKILIEDTKPNKYKMEIGGGITYNSVRIHYQPYLTMDKIAIYYDFFYEQPINLSIGWGQYGFIRKYQPEFNSQDADFYQNDILLAVTLTPIKYFSFYSEYEMRNFRFFVGVRINFYTKNTVVQIKSNTELEEEIQIEEAKSNYKRGN